MQLPSDPSGAGEKKEVKKGDPISMHPDAKTKFSSINCQHRAA